MRRARSRILFLTVVLGVAAAGPIQPVRAQSMGEAARRERERRRARNTKPAKVYTDADLEARRTAGSRAPIPAPSPAEGSRSVAPALPASEGKLAEDEAAERKRLEADWRIRFAEARRKIAEAELRCWRSVIRTVFVAGIPVQQWVKEFEESEELRQAKRALQDLEEEFRRTGLPPGWTRE